MPAPSGARGARRDDAGVRGEIEASLGALLEAVNAELPAHERLRMIVVAREPWTIDNGCLTPTMKIKRSRIEETVADRLDDWYGRGARVVWA